MKLNEVTETGYYTCELDTERETIFEVIKNTDEVWLKETPEQTLLIDEWTYEYTDEDGRKHYEIYGGNLVSVVNAEPFDVVKITDTKYIISGKMGTHLMEDKPTRLEITEHQLKHKEQECEELKEDKELWKSNFEGMVGAIEDLSHQLDQLKVEIEQEKALKETYLTCYKAKHEDIEGALFKLKQTLTEIKAICNNNDELQGDFNVVDCDKYKLGKHNLANKILQKIKEYKVEE